MGDDGKQMADGFIIRTMNTGMHKVYLWRNGWFGPCNGNELLFRTERLAEQFISAHMPERLQCDVCSGTWAKAGFSRRGTPEGDLAELVALAHPPWPVLSQS